MTLEQLRTKANSLNVKVGIREEQRKTALEELAKLGINPDEIDNEIAKLQAEVLRDEENIRSAETTLEAKLNEVEGKLV